MFIPPHCPNPACEHYQRPKTPLWYSTHGHYWTKTFGRIPRFRCKACRIGFSSQTFSIDYFAKRALDYGYIYSKVNDGAGLRKIGRDLHASCASVINRIHRLARNAVLVNQQIVDRLPLDEDLVLDGLQNFCVSQYFPDNYTIAVGKRSQFVYECDYATIRRTGRMTARQRKRRAELEKVFRPPTNAIRKSFSRALDVARRKSESRRFPLILYTDEKTDYQRALWKSSENRKNMVSGQWRHHRTSSKVGRNTQNPLFAVNYIDREIRKDMASQARETVQFPRNVSNAMLRMYLYLFDHNVRKPYRIRMTNAESRRSHAETAGLDRKILVRITRGYFSSRFFRPPGIALSESARMTLDGEWVTPPKAMGEVFPKHLVA